jgi:hypothetical protein
MDDPLFWNPLISRFHGLRMEEASQLRPKDVGKLNGIPSFSYAQAMVRSWNPRTRSARFRCGARWLLDVERGLDGTFSSRFSKTYHNWRRSMGIYEAGKDFHSLQKDFYQDLKGARVDYAARVVLMGHALNDVSETSYGLREWEIDDLRDFIYAIPADTGHIKPVFRL